MLERIMGNFQELQNKIIGNIKSIIRGKPERAPNTREAGSGFICIYVCLWSDDFREKRVK